MKKDCFIAFLTIVGFLSCAFDLQAQTNNPYPARYHKYHYTEWYDECFMYQNGGWYDSVLYENIHFFHVGSGYLAKREYTDHPIRVRGLVGLVAPESRWNHLSYDRLPEYLYLIKRIDYVDTIMPQSPIQHFRVQVIDSVRFDTVTPRFFELVQACSEIPSQYCFAYEAYFKSPIIVDSEFYIAGSNNSGKERVITSSGTYGPFIYHPVDYLEVEADFVPVSPWPGGHFPYPYTMDFIYTLACHAEGEHNTMLFSNSPYALTGYDWIPYPFTGDPWFETTYIYPHDPYGLYFPIVFHYQLDALPDDSTMGAVEGSGYYDDNANPVIHAIPNEGYAFRHWNDGNTENPRTVMLSQDTAFIAYFSEAAYFNVSGQSNNMEWGTVEGSGVYAEQTEATLTAVPAPHCIFEQWSDGDWHSTRTLMVTQDTTLTAIFWYDSSLAIQELRQLKFGIAPNPTGSLLTVTTDDKGPALVEVFDNSGRCVLQKKVQGPQETIDVSSLPDGHYTLRLTMNEKSGTRRFIKHQ